MACPFFSPTERFAGGAWAHPSRLPLGDGYRGHCTAVEPGAPQPTDQQLLDHCNLGYAVSCPNLPTTRRYDAIRFSIARVSAFQITVRYCCEANHLPGEHGFLEFLKPERRWTTSHSNPVIQRQAEYYLESYLRRTDTADSAPAKAAALASELS